VTDTLTPAQRSARMARIRAANTRPELIVRRGLHRLGFRFRLHEKRLPGRPDIVLPRYKVVVLVHGCFWHRHRGCRIASDPKSHKKFWQQKFAANVARDARVRRLLRRLGWRVLIVWECQVSTGKRATATLERTRRKILLNNESAPSRTVVK
jgi:DNA mismatch endonuclease, patch repair protein